MTVLAMRHGELSLFDTLMRVERGKLQVEDAAALLGLKRRQVFRLLDRLRTDGAAVLSLASAAGQAIGVMATRSENRSSRSYASTTTTSAPLWRASI